MLLLIYFFLAIGVSFLCSILEAVLLSITVSHIEMTKKEHPKRAKMMDKQKKNINLSIGSILTLNTFAHTLGAAGVGAQAVKIFGEEYMFYISFVLTLMILIFSEIIPKTLGATYWRGLSTFSTYCIKYLVIITYPLIISMNFITRFIGKNESDKVTKEEICAIANVAEESGSLKENETDVIENLLSLSDLKVKDIHTPRSVMFFLRKDALIKSFEDKNSIDLQKLNEYSRIPIIGENIDDIEGLIISKEYYLEYIERNFEDKSEIIKPVYKVNENIPLTKLLELFISRKEQMFIVVDNYEQTEGLVTLEDVIETLLGMEIIDESDKIVDKREEAKRRMKTLRKKLMEQK